MSENHQPTFRIQPARQADVPIILQFIKDLAEYERLSHEMVATEEILARNLFGERRTAEVILAFENDDPVGFALFFHNFSTFLGMPGIYLEDLFVIPSKRDRGYGKALLLHLAKLAVARGCGRLEWSVLDWNEPAIGFYRKLGANSMDEWTVFRVAGETLNRLAAASRS